LIEPEWDFLWNTPSTTQIQELCENSDLDIGAILQDCYTVFCQMTEYRDIVVRDSLSAIARDKGIKLKVLMHILRVSLSGLKVICLLTHKSSELR
jgi:hypothetical protein